MVKLKAVIVLVDVADLRPVPDVIKLFREVIYGAVT
jgi:hypothetical protein